MKIGNGNYLAHSVLYANLNTISLLCGSQIFIYKASMAITNKKLRHSKKRSEWLFSKPDVNGVVPPSVREDCLLLKSHDSPLYVEPITLQFVYVLY